MENIVKTEEPAQSLGLDLQDFIWDGIQESFLDNELFEYKQSPSEEERVASPLSTSSTGTGVHDIACVPNWMTNYLQFGETPIAGELESGLDSTKVPALELEINTATTNAVADDEFNDENLKQISVKELNRMVKQKGLSKDEVARIKYQRRTIKNRGYAQNCRVKRIKQKQSLEEENTALQNQVQALQSQLASVTKERDEMKIKYKQVKKFVLASCSNQNKIIAS